MAETQETIADIIAEARDKYTVHECNQCAWRKCCSKGFGSEECGKFRESIFLKLGIEDGYFTQLLDRFEAAHKRERDVMFDALVRIGNWCAQDLAENAYVSDSSGNYLKTLNGLCEVCRPFMRKANKLKKYGGTND